MIAIPASSRSRRVSRTGRRPWLATRTAVWSTIPSSSSSHGSSTGQRSRIARILRLAYARASARLRPAWHRAQRPPGGQRSQWYDMTPPSLGRTNVTTRVHDPLPFSGAKRLPRASRPRIFTVGAWHGFESRGSYSLVVAVAVSQPSSAVSGRPGYARLPTAPADLKTLRRAEWRSAPRRSERLAERRKFRKEAAAGPWPGMSTDGGHPASRVSPAPRLTTVTVRLAA
jgi:hypothetical protein